MGGRTADLGLDSEMHVVAAAGGLRGFSPLLTVHELSFGGKLSQNQIMHFLISPTVLGRCKPKQLRERIPHKVSKVMAVVAAINQLPKLKVSKACSHPR